MKADERRRIFNDAVDLLSADEPETDLQNTVQMLSVDGIRPFPGHPFHLYEGTRLDEMIESVKTYGILHPVIVRKYRKHYEMLSGHNRLQAAKAAGLKEIPAIVKEGLSEKEAWVYVIETNLLQRSFSELSVSEKAAVLAERYDKVLYARRKDEIMQELRRLEGIPEKVGHDVLLSADGKTQHRDEIGEEYGLSGRSVARLLRVNQLVPELKAKVDDGRLNLTAAVQLSYASEDIQKAVAETDAPISKEMAQKLRSDGMTADAAKELLTASSVKKSLAAGKSVRIAADVYERYFHKVNARDAAKIIEDALNAWFAGKEAADVS